MGKSIDLKLKEFMEDMAKLLDAKLASFKKEIEAKIVPPASIPLPQPGTIIGPIQNCQLDVFAMELTAKIRQQ